MATTDGERLVKHFVEEDTVLRSYVLAATRDPHQTQDILQNVWAILWRKLAEYDETRPFRAWAFGVARMEVLKWRQRQARSREYLSAETLERLAETAVEQTAELDLRAQFVRECLTQLKGLWRSILIAKYYQGQPIRAIAATLGKSIAAVEMILVRARRSLRECVERKTQAPDGEYGTVA
jgi:RNA polymerase sigma-70 factor, ECF subfamily